MMTSSYMNITLSEDQQIAFDKIAKWLADSTFDGKRTDLLTFAGFAGSGKTTILSYIASQFKNAIRFAFCALSGKAASVLRNKLIEQGFDFDDKVHYCGTIHSMIYQPVENDDGEVIYWAQKDEVGYDLIVVDEASMISEDIYNDLKRYGKPILAVGDHGQLPPISGKFSFMANPMIRLEKIHRQAESNPIINLSMQIRTTGQIPKVKESEHIKVVSKKDHVDFLRNEYSKIKSVDSLLDRVVLCYKNATRTRLNTLIRSSVFGNKETKPQPNDIVICLRNSKDKSKSKKPPIFNGYRGYLQGSVSANGDDHYKGKIYFPYEGFSIQEEHILKHQFGFAKTFSAFSELEIFGMFDVTHWRQVGLLFDYGYSMTVHKCQGSQMGTVILYNERPYMVTDDDYKRWSYTAVTRSSDKLILII